MGNIIYDRSGNLVKTTFTFATMNNKVDPSRLDIAKGECSALVNVLPTNKEAIYLRPGYTISNPLDITYGWSNGTIAYLVYGNLLYHFDGTNYTLIQSIQTSNVHEFVQVNDVVVYTNYLQYLILEGASAYEPNQHTDEFKIPPVPGQCLEYYNGRVYIAKDNCLYCTDPFTTEQMDSRQCIVMVYDSNITGVKRVDDGLYISTEKEFFFINVDDPYSENGINQEVLANFPIIKGSIVQTNGDAFPIAGMDGSIVVFATKNGIIVGGNGGSYKNLSYDKISYDYGETAASTLYEYNGSHYYLVSFPSNTNATNQYTIPNFAVEQLES